MNGFEPRSSAPTALSTVPKPLSNVATFFTCATIGPSCCLSPSSYELCSKCSKSSSRGYFILVEKLSLQYLKYLMANFNPKRWF